MLVVHLLVAAAVCGFVLMQHGKGADMGAAFGSGSSGSLFGASGSANFLSRTTAILATVFFLISLGLTFFGAHQGPSAGRDGAGRDGAPAPAAPKTPDVPKPADVSAAGGGLVHAPAAAGSVPQAGRARSNRPPGRSRACQRRRTRRTHRSRLSTPTW